ncbi:MAG: 30S ribosomal protein S11 [Candidatus Nealsonbacteria bacterium]|nr:30S ribosomal protein S11 [Candidatus Nealsonbacteria bacterium]
MGKKKVIKQTESELLKEGEKAATASKKEVKAEAPVGRVQEGRVYISSSYNNTILTLTDFQGNVLSWASAGSIGFKGTKKATPFAASKVAEVIFQTIQKLGIKKLSILVKGIGGGRESAVRSFAAKGIEIVAVTDMTPVPHDGPRARKVRRV